MGIHVGVFDASVLGPCTNGIHEGEADGPLVGAWLGLLLGMLLGETLVGGTVDRRKAWHCRRRRTRHSGGHARPMGIHVEVVDGSALGPSTDGIHEGEADGPLVGAWLGMLLDMLLGE